MNISEHINKKFNKKLQSGSLENNNHLISTKKIKRKLKILKQLIQHKSTGILKKHKLGFLSNQNQYTTERFLQ